MEERSSIGYLLAKVESLGQDVVSLKAEVAMVRSEVTVVRQKLDEMKGGWKLLAGLMSASAAAGAVATALASWVTNKVH